MLAKRNPNFYGLILRKNFRASLKWGLVFGGILVVPIFIEVLLGWQNIEIPKFWLSTIIFQVIFAGFCEEILYRGYYQSRINETFDRPWDISGLKFGIGLIAISVLFGFAHVLNTYNPLQGQYSFDWVGGLIALQTGLFYGFVREKTGSILASAVIHGSTFWWDFLADGSTRYIGMSIGWCISWIVLFAIFSRTKSTEYDDLGSQSHVPIT
jgi:membrane protease YdiL (CAAX protease family)